ncbi:MAG: hypothetical protein AAF329_27800 [Cyanobacteria bacterium P01_A01_bin.17]
MTKISVDIGVAFPRALVYTTYRDKLMELGPCLPNVRSLQIKSRQEIDQQVRLELEWHGGGDIPAAAQAFLSEELFTWTQYDVWECNEFTGDWRIETHFYREAVFLAGKNHFVDQGNHTVVENRGDLKIDLSGIPGVPSVMLGKLVRLVEGLVAKKIESNMVQMGQNVLKYLEQTQSHQQLFPNSREG